MTSASWRTLLWTCLRLGPVVPESVTRWVERRYHRRRSFDAWVAEFAAETTRIAEREARGERAPFDFVSGDAPECGADWDAGDASDDVVKHELHDDLESWPSSRGGVA